MCATPPSGPIARGTLVLRQLAAANAPVSLTQLARATTLPKSTVHRILENLAQAGATIRTPAGHTLSHEWSELLRPVGRHEHPLLRRLLTPYLVELHRATGLVCDLAVREGSDVVFLTSIYGHDNRAKLSWLPLRAPAHCTAAGQVLLAFDPRGLETLAEGPLAAVTPHTVTDIAELRSRLTRIRTRGVAVTHGERVPGMLGLSVPVAGRDGVPVCALSVGGPENDVRPELVIPQLRSMAHAGSVELRAYSRHR